MPIEFFTAEEKLAWGTMHAEITALRAIIKTTNADLDRLRNEAHETAEMLCKAGAEWERVLSEKDAAIEQLTARLAEAEELARLRQNGGRCDF